MGKTCFFIGHREMPEGVFERLVAEVERCVEEGVTDFVVGQYGNFDRLAARTVKDVKRRWPVTLALLLPYHPANRPVDTPDGFDCTFYPPGMETVPKRVTIVRANHYMVEHSDVLIAYACHPASNARELVEFARRREKRGLIAVRNLGEEG